MGAASVTATTTGAGPFVGLPTPGIWITSNGNLVVSSASTTTEGVIVITAPGNLDAQSITTNGATDHVRLEATGGDLTVGLITSKGIVNLIAGKQILDGDTTNDVTANSLMLKAGTGIGAVDPLETTVSFLAWDSGTSSIALSNTGVSR